MAAVTKQQQIGQRRQFTWRELWILLLVLAVLFVVVGIIGGNAFNWKWTGFKGQTLWDWLNLLITPILVAALPIVISGLQNKNNSSATEQPSPADSQTTDDHQQEAALEAYQDYMLGLLLDKNLGKSQPGSEVREAARAKTLAALRRIDKSRKGDLLRFLHEAGLIYKAQAIIDLREADLRWADLSDARLNGINLCGANLSGARLTRTDLSWADLSMTDLSGTDLSGCNLSSANLSNANLNGANLLGATYTKEQLGSTKSYSNSII